MTGEFVVIGMGRFGLAVAATLRSLGQSVLVVDSDPARVQELSAEFDAALCADGTDEKAIAELGLRRMACAVVAIGEQSLEASILVTAVLRQVGVPRIIARAVSPLHMRVLRAVGAHEVVNPELHMGERLGRKLAHPSVLEQLDLGEATDIAEIETPEAFAGKTLLEVDVRRKYRITVVAIKRGSTVRAALTADETIQSGDVLVVIGAPADIRKVAALA